MKRVVGILAGLAALLSGLPARAGFTVPRNAPGAYAPRDECARLPGATAFRTSLRNVVQRRDAAALASLASPTIGLDYGGGSGRAELRKRLTGADGPELWRELDALMTLGCATNAQGEMILPWFFAQELGDVDPYETMLATGDKVPLYSSRNVRGRQAAWLNWQLVVPRALRAPRGFRSVAVINSRLQGLVPENRLRSLVGYRLFAAREKGVWQITMFIAGD